MHTALRRRYPDLQCIESSSPQLSQPIRALCFNLGLRASLGNFSLWRIQPPKPAIGTGHGSWMSLVSLKIGRPQSIGSQNLIKFGPPGLGNPRIPEAADRKNLWNQPETQPLELHSILEYYIGFASIARNPETLGFEFTHLEGLCV